MPPRCSGRADSWSCRELTKIHEEFVRTTTDTAPDTFRAREVIGEYTLVFGAAAPVEEVREQLSDASVWTALRALADAGCSRREAIAELARQEGQSSKDIYAAAERGKGPVAE